MPLSACSNLPTCFSVAPGERAFLVPEQLRLDQLLGNRRAVDLDEPFAAALAVAVDGPRHELLADAAFALYEDSRVGRRGAADGRHHLRQAGALADHLVPDFDGLLERPVFVAQPGAVELVLNRQQKAIGARRLLDEVRGAFPDRVDGRRRGAMGREHDDRQRGKHRVEACEHVKAVHAGHLDVEQHEVRRLALGQRQTLLAGCGA